MNKGDSIILFDNKDIRRYWNADEEIWYFSIIDIIQALTKSSSPRRYWSDLKIKLKSEGSQVYEKIVRLKLFANDGKKRETDCLSTEDLLRLIQSVPSPNAEPFKIWLARVGYERIEETEDPQLSIDRAMKTYLRKGYSNEWINQRLKSIEVRKELTDEWNKRGVDGNYEFALLTDEISLAWAGLSVKSYKKFKNLRKQNLRDNMTNLELVLNMLAEATTSEISKKKLPNGFVESIVIARQGGKVAGVARQEIEKKTGENVVTRKNAKDILAEKKFHNEIE